MNIRWIDSLGLDQGRESDRSSTAGLRHSPDLSSDVSLRLRDSISTIIISICMRSIMRRNCTGRVTVRLCLYFSLRSTPAPRVLHRSKGECRSPYVCRLATTNIFEVHLRHSIFNDPPDAQLMTSIPSRCHLSEVCRGLIHLRSTNCEVIPAPHLADESSLGVLRLGMAIYLHRCQRGRRTYMPALVKNRVMSFLEMFEACDSYLSRDCTLCVHGMYSRR